MVYFDFEPGERYRSAWSPPLDVYENTEEIVIRVELPGVDKADIELEWQTDVLTLSGTKSETERSRRQVRYVCAERQYGRFRRDITIRTGVDFTRATATFRNGLLEIRLPRTDRANNASAIPID